MTIYVVSYDLHKIKDYDRMFQGIVSVSNNTYTKPLESLFVIQAEGNALEVRNALFAYLDSDDSIVVIEANRQNWDGFNLPKEAIDWLNT